MKRLEWIDISKAIGIILVVFGHALTENTYIWKVIQQFHMPLFFIISGYLFCENNNLKKFILKRIKTLWFPYVSANIILLLLFDSQNIFAVNKIIKIIFMLCISNNLLGATWFLQSLFYISIFSAILYNIIKKIIYSKNDYIAYVCIIVFFILGFKLPSSYHIAATSMGEAYFLLGHILKKKNLLKKIFELNNYYLFSIFCFCLCLLLSISIINYAGFSQSEYDYPILSIISALSGTLCVFLVSIKCFRQSKLLLCIGRYTLSIMMWHFVAFKLVILLQIYLYHLDFSVITSHPYYNNCGIWLYFLTIIGIVFPMLVSNIYHKIKKTCLVIFGKKLAN